MGVLLPAGVGAVLLVERHRSAGGGAPSGRHNRLGYAVQLATVRSLGRFLPDPLEVPWPLVEFVAGQLQIVDPSVLKRYAQRLGP